MSTSKTALAFSASSMVTSFMVRVAGFIVVSQSCSGFISPNPLKRWMFTPLTAVVSAIVSPASGSFISSFATSFFFVLFSFRFRVDVADVLCAGDAVERRLGDVEVSGGDELEEVAVEEGEQQGADVRAVHVGVGHDDDAVVAQGGDVELLTDVGSHGDDEIPEFVVAEHLVEARALDVQNFSAEREDGLEFAVPSLFGAAARGIPLDDVEFGAGRVACRAVGKLSRKREPLEHALPEHGLARRTRGEPGAGGEYAFFEDLLRVSRVFFKEDGERVAERGLDRGAHLRVSEFILGLTLELRVLHFDGDDRGQPLAHILAREVLVFFFQKPLLARIGVEHAGERRPEADKVRASSWVVDVVR